MFSRLKIDMHTVAQKYIILNTALRISTLTVFS